MYITQKYSSEFFENEKLSNIQTWNDSDNPVIHAHERKPKFYRDG